MFAPKKVGFIPLNILDAVRIDFENVTAKNVFKVIYRSLFTNMSEDELYSDRHSLASLVLLAKALDQAFINNAVKLVVNGKVVFEDKHSKQNDLDEMKEAIDSHKISHFDSAEITMEAEFCEIYYHYILSVHKNDEGVMVYVTITGKHEVEDPGRKEMFDDHVAAFEQELGLVGVIFDKAA